MRYGAWRGVALAAVVAAGCGQAAASVEDCQKLIAEDPAAAAELMGSFHAGAAVDSVAVEQTIEWMMGQPRTRMMMAHRMMADPQMRGSMMRILGEGGMGPGMGPGMTGPGTEHGTMGSDTSATDR